MKHNEWENDGFDELLRDALASDAAPSGDFTERLSRRAALPAEVRPWRDCRERQHPSLRQGR